MLHLDNPHAQPDPRTIAAGGFLWSYAEVMDANGNGIVAIWSWGLPFLPGIASSARLGHPVAPSTRPSFNLAVYERGKQVAYVLKERRPAEVRQLANGWRFGDTVIETTGTDAQRTLRICVDEPVPHGHDRIRGEIVLTGVVPRVTPQPLVDGPAHAWTPLLGVAQGRVSLQTDSWQFACEGAGYHDRNQSPVPLHELGLDTWFWCRAQVGDTLRIAYVLWPRGDKPPRTVGLELSAAGDVRVLDEVIPVIDRAGVTWFGMPDLRRVCLMHAGEPWLDLTLGQYLDHGPFYIRAVPEVSAGGLSVHGASAEVIVPDRIDLDVHRWMVQMRVAPAHGAGDPMLAWFQGPHAHRLERLVRARLPQLPGLRTMAAWADSAVLR